MISGQRRASAINPTGTLIYPPIPSTIFGRMRASSRALCTHARNKLNGNSRMARSPLPRTPPKSTRSIATPCFGASLASIPNGLPIQTTFAPRALRDCATASPGNTCPPVPPAAMSTVRGRDAGAPLQKALEPFSVRLHKESARSDGGDPAAIPNTENAEATPGKPLKKALAFIIFLRASLPDSHNPPASAAPEQCSSSQCRSRLAEQRQCEALGRQQTEIDPHIDERLYANPQSDALGGQRGKDAIQRERLPANRKGAPHQPCK